MLSITSGSVRSSKRKKTRSSATKSRSRVSSTSPTLKPKKVFRDQNNLMKTCCPKINCHQRHKQPFQNGFKYLAFFFVLLSSRWTCVSSAATSKGVWRRVEALSGREAVLPCEVGALEEADMIYVVLWYKNGEKEPIYSYDNRPRGLQPAEDRHIIQSSVLKGRVSFRPGHVPALHIRPVAASDQANYTCRVDFRIASSRSTHLSLQVVIPPSQPFLQSEEGRLLSRGAVLGPLHEGEPLTITCVVQGGEPRPSLVWYRRDQIIDSMAEDTLPDVKVLSRRERYKPRNGPRMLGLRSGGRSPKRSKLYRSLAGRSGSYSRGPNRRNVNGHSFSYRRGISRRSLTYNVAKGSSIEEISEGLTNSGETGDGGNSEHSSGHTGRIVINQLHIKHLSREFHDEQLTCVASNNNVTAPSAAHVTVIMNLRPLTVRMIEAPKELRIGRSYDIKCVTTGSRPEPNITWTLGNVASLYTVPSQTEHNVNMSVSSVRIKAERKIHGQRLTCKALNHRFPASPLSDSLLLNVTYPPVASLELGRGVASIVREGEDVYFNCMVDSNPPTYKISWYHEDTPILHAPSDGFVVSGQSLALRNVRRDQAGKYVCSASNVEGDAKSPPVTLHVSYAPVCSSHVSSSVTSSSSSPSSTSSESSVVHDAAISSSSTTSAPITQVLASGIGQTLNVSCSVVASPADVKFSWVFNNSVTSERVPIERVYHSEMGGWSGVMFVARTQQDYGTLQCWAENSVGKMNKPCLFHIVPAGRPDTPSNCSVTNKTYDSLVVICEEGFNGGLKQSFVARVYEAVTGRGQVNVSSPSPRFTLDGLTPGLDYTITVSAINQLGESDLVKLEAFTYKMAENRMRDEKINPVGTNTRSSRTDVPSTSGPDFTAGALLGALLILIVALLLTGIVLRCAAMRRTQRRRQDQHHSPRSSSKNSGQQSDDENDIDDDDEQDNDDESQVQPQQTKIIPMTRLKGNLLVTSEQTGSLRRSGVAGGGGIGGGGGGGRILTSGSSVVFLPPPPILQDRDDTSITTNILQRLPPDTETPFEIPSLPLNRLDNQGTLVRASHCGTCRVPDQPL